MDIDFVILWVDRILHGVSDQELDVQIVVKLKKYKMEN